MELLSCDFDKAKVETCDALPLRLVASRASSRFGVQSYAVQDFSCGPRACKSLAFFIRLRSQCAWRARINRVCSAVCAAATAEELELAYALDPLVSTWLAASLSGLTARKIGGARKKLPRFCRAFGVGINRRSFVRVRRRCAEPSISAAYESDFVSCWCNSGVADPVVPGVDAPSVLSDALQETPSALLGWQQKCLQNAVAGLSNGTMANAFGSCCANHERSGGCDGLLASRNLYTVEHVLRKARAYVKVIASQSEAAFVQGRFRGWWALGDGAGENIGCIV